MKKVSKIVFISLIALLITGCSNSASNENALKVACTLDPHSKILEEAKPILKEKYNIDLEIQVLDDYYIFNKSLNNDEVDANYFQHLPFFEEDVTKNKYDLVNAGGIHIEPFGIYSKTYKDVKDIKDGASIIVSNSIADNGRILSILADAKLITIPADKNVFDITIADIKDSKEYNPKGLKFSEVKPEFLVTTFNNKEADLVAINGNYAIQGGLNPMKDSIILESANQDNPYVNIVATTSKLKDDKKTKALVDVLQSKEIQNFITKTYSNGAVIPATK